MSRSRTRSLARFIALLSALALLPACAAVDDEPSADVASVGAALKSRLPTIPEGLAVPAGQRLAFTLHAEGVQIYDCKAGADGALAWVFRAPEADLFVGRHVVGNHYAGPTWEALDGSTVVGARVAGATVDSSAIPWLLLKASANTGRGLMSSVTYIQRLSTVAGLAPSTGCDASTAGAASEVSYTATYAFYQEICGH
jgi:Protein of unknown function (DUF3455)